MTTCRCRLLSAVLIVLAALGSSSALAEAVLVGNLDEPFRDATPIANPEFWGAQSFVCDESDRPLSSIMAIVGNGENSPQVVAELRTADVDGEIDVTPGGLLTTFTAPDMSGPASVRLFMPDSPVTLVASQQYWFILGSSNEGTFDWSYAGTNFWIGSGSLHNYADSSEAGANWINRGNDFPYFIQVNYGVPTGACCLGNGACIPDMDAFICAVEFGGTYLGDNTECTALSCCTDPVLLSNLSEPFRADTPIANPEFWGAQAFRPGDNDHVLTSIEAIVGNGANSPQVVAELRQSDINGSIDVTPGGLLTPFTAPDMSGATSVRLFTPDSAVTLIASEQYWFVLGSSNEGTFDWSYAGTNLFTGPGVLGNFADSSDAGASWTLGDNSFPYFIQVNVECGAPDPDSDGDTVPDSQDECPNTVPGATVDATGCPPFIRFDFDRDGDVDHFDFDTFNGCSSGPAIPHNGSDNCVRSDADSENDVDSSDFAAFQRCYSGEGNPADPNCCCSQA